tara:strand:- start:156 stop:1088 length:933 start_codon:yes stop_codon:yes gene_type:complete
MINREDFLKEQLLRENIRKAIRISKAKRIQEENYVRAIVRSLLSEATTFKYEYTSLNQLAHFIKEAVGDPAKPDSNPAFKDAYTDLTSDHNDREQFVEFIMDFADEDFNTIDADREPQALGQDFVDKGFSDLEAEEEPEEEKDELIKLSIQDLEDKGGDVTGEPEEEEEEEDEIFSIGEDGEIVEDSEDELEGIKRFSRESYKRIGPVLRRYYLNVPKNMPIKKAVQIDDQEYTAGELSERDLFKIYFKKNMALWASRYEDEFFNDRPETNIDIESEEEEQEIEDITPDAQIENDFEKNDDDQGLDPFSE